MHSMSTSTLARQIVRERLPDCDSGLSPSFVVRPKLHWARSLRAAAGVRLALRVLLPRRVAGSRHSRRRVH